MRYAKILKSNNMVFSVATIKRKGGVVPDEDTNFYYVEIDEIQDVGDCVYINGAFTCVGAPPSKHHVLQGTQWVDTRANEEKIAQVQEWIRQKRDGLLRGSDWTQIPDSPLEAQDKVKWQQYRQALRDLPAQYADETDINNVVFPTAP